MADSGSEALGLALQASSPPDDAGAQTLDRYEWQAMMATADLLALYLEVVDADREPTSGSDCGLVCEYHEDWARIRADDVQLVSAKHKEPRFGAYTTVASLLDDGGVYHLFDRWFELGGNLSTRLITTAGLDGDAALVHDLCAHHRSDGLMVPVLGARAAAAYTRLVDGVASRRGASSLAAIPGLRATVLPRFLAGLDLQHGSPRREHVPALAPTAYAEPVACAIGHPDLAVPIWEAVLSLVRARMRAAGPAHRGLLPALTVDDEAGFERRVVTVADAHVAVMTAVATPGGFAPLPRLTISNRMAVKMAEGRCAATSIERAEALRRRFASWRRDQRSQPGGRSVDIELLLLRVADHATAVTRTDTDPWGAALWSELERRLAFEAGHDAAASLDSDMLLGGVSQLTNDCRVWYSESFDATARLRAVLGERP